MTAFSPELLAEIQARLPLDRLIGQTVAMKRQGRSWRGKCPFHGSRSQSFSVKGSGYRCFNCGEKGDHFTWTMAQDHVGFVEAVRRLAAEAGVDLPDHRQDRDNPAEVARLARERADRLAEYQRKRDAEDAAERAAAIAVALGVWRQSVPIASTLGEKYLIEVRGIARPASGWPDCLRYHAAKRMLVAAGTTDDGAVQFVHCIYLRPDATNARRSDGSKRKITRGPMDGAAIRLPGSGDDVQHAEGLETGLAAWVVTGITTFVYAGAVTSRLMPQPGLNIVLRDDDAPGSPADKLLADAVMRWRDAGINFAVAEPWPERRGDKSDFNDVLRENGADAVAAAIRDRIFHGGLVHVQERASGNGAKARAATSLPAYYPAPTEDRDTAKARQDAALTAHMVEGGRLAHLRHELHRRRAEAIAAVGGEDALTSGAKATITRRLHREIAAREGYGTRLPLAPRHMFSGAQGTGKTTVARQFAAASPGLTTWITEATFEKSSEEYLAYLGEVGPDSPPAMLIRGRERPDPMRPGHFMCDRHKAARRIAESGNSVPELLCQRCEFNGHCGDHRQRREADALVEARQGAVFFLAGNYAFLPSPVPMPDHAILDESLLQLATDIRTVPLEKIATLSVPNIDTTGADTAEIIGAIVTAFTVPHPTTPERVAAGDDRIMPRPLAHLRHAGIDRKALRYLAKATRAEIDRQTPAINAEMTDAEIEAALDWDDRRQLRHLLALVSALLTEIDLPCETATGIWETTLSDAPALAIARLRRLRGLRRAALTVLDGTGKLSLARKLYGERLAETRVVFERQAHVIGTKGRSYSRQSITGEDSCGNAIKSKVASAARLRGDIATIYDRLPAGSAVGATKRVEDMLFDSRAVHRDTPAMHFAALRGRNVWETCPGALLIGAENISIADVEAMARAFLAGDPVPFVSMDEVAPKGWRWEHQWPYRATRMRRMRDGSASPVEVPVHPDPRMQDVLELIREDELMQAFDRPRPVWHRRQFILLNDLCLDVTYDAIYSHKHLVAGGNPVERAYLASGIVPLSPADLHRAHPTIFRSPKAAEHALRNYPLNANSSPIWDCGVVLYRRVGQRGPEARLLLDRSRQPDPVAAVEAAVGPLQSFEGVTLRIGEMPGVASEPMTRNAGWIAPPPRQPGSGAEPPSIMVHGPPDD